MTDDPTKNPQPAINVAAECVTHSFNGKPLYAFNHSRMTCWGRIGFDGPILDTYDALIFIVFICTLGDEIMETHEGRNGQKINVTGKDWIAGTRTPEGVAFFQDKECEWADGLGITRKNKIGKEAFKVGFAIWDEMEKSKFEIVSTPTTTGTAPPNE